MAADWYRGNAEADGDTNRGWILGHFINPEYGPRSTEDLEVKWGMHRAGEERESWVTGERRTTMTLLVEGRFSINLGKGYIEMSHRGDYLVWGPGVDHIWRVEEDSVVITVRWPSILPTV